mgnify:CR=1 FL=1
MTDENWTRLPNYVIDNMPNMEDSELRVVLMIVRQTLGFQKEWDRISFSQFIKVTGIKHPLSIQRGIEAALKRGIIERRGSKNSYEYRVRNPENTSLSEAILSQNTSLSEPKITSLDEAKITSLDEAKTEITSLSEPKSLHSVKTQKKEEIIHPTDVAERPQDVPPQSLVNQFHQLMEELKTTKNRTAKLREIYILCYGENCAPDFGYLGKVAAQVGGAGYLAQRMWELAARPPNGDVLAYITAEHKGKQARRNGKATIGDNAEIWHDIGKQDLPDYMKELMA